MKRGIPISEAIKTLTDMLEQYGDVEVYPPERVKRFHISRYWRGDNEDTETEDFLTQDEAFAWLKKYIEESILKFKDDEKAEGFGPTVFDFESLKNELLAKGYARQEYAQCSAWWDNFSYWAENIG